MVSCPTSAWLSSSASSHVHSQVVASPSCQVHRRSPEGLGHLVCTRILVALEGTEHTLLSQRDIKHQQKTLQIIKAKGQRWIEAGAIGMRALAPR